MEDRLHTDGNDVGGLLGEAFGAELTTARRRCRGCGRDSALGELRAFHGAAVVLRCPGCDDIALRIGRLGGELVFEWRGTFRTAG